MIDRRGQGRRKGTPMNIHRLRSTPESPPQGKRTGLRRSFGASFALLLTLGGVALAPATAAHAAGPSALINGDTVSGGTASPEAVDATNAGFAVTVVDGPTWDSMTAAQFGSYSLLIAGDPTCSNIAPSFSSNESTWAPVVMGTAGGRTHTGNRVVVGTDPVFHGGGNLPEDQVVRDGIAYAGSQLGTTGLYFDTSCGGNYGGQIGLAASMLQPLSTGTGTWTEDDNPPCGGNVAVIATTPLFSSLSTADLEGWGCSVHESFPTYASDWSPLAVATDTTSHPTCGTDNTVTPPATACGEAYILIAGSSIVVTSPNITLTPATGSSPAGGTHTVTANVTLSGAPVVGQVVTFTVTGQNGGATGTCAPVSCVTDANGNVSFTYSDTNGAGADTILAAFTDSSGTNQQASASQNWVASGICTMAVGRGSTGPGDVGTVVNNLSTNLGSPQQLEFTWNNHAHHVNLVTLTSAKCGANDRKPSPGLTFQGTGTATLDGIGGYSVQFAIGSNATGNWVVAVQIKKGSTIVNNFVDALPVSSEVIS
jgi:hypothetical protein